MHTKGPEIFRSLAYSEREAYSATMERFEEIVNRYNFLKYTSFSRSLFREINIMNFF